MSASEENVQAASFLSTVADEVDLETLEHAVEEGEQRNLPAPKQAVLQRVPEVMDDFIRNFLLRHAMHETLENFEREWYDMHGAQFTKTTPTVPDNYLESAALLDRIEVLERDLRRQAELTTRSTRQCAALQRDSEYHRTSHGRVVQENARLRRELRQARAHVAKSDPTLAELRQRCDSMLKSRALVTIERDRLVQQVAALEEQLGALKNSREESRLAGTDSGHPAGDARRAATKTRGALRAPAAARERRGAPSTSAAAAGGFVWPPDQRPREVRAVRPTTNWADVENRSTFTAHALPISHVALHPLKPAVASSSDDGSWRLSALPQGELIISGEAHKSWVSSIAVHPTGTMLATGSGDTTVKLWDLARNSCSATLAAHTEGVWCVAFQDSGALVASGSLDQTARVWDVEYGKCRQTLRGHADAVNGVAWQAGTNTLCTGGGDKTVSLWDSRMNCCVQSFYGHRSAVLSVTTVDAGDVLVSCDAEGAVVLWDVRRMEQRSSFGCGPYPANHVAVDGAGANIAVASDDSTIKLINVAEGSFLELTGHEDAVQCAVFDPVSEAFLVSCGSDRTIRYWS